MAVDFIFVRHGATDWNARGIMMGNMDIPLSEIGIKQARFVTDKLLNYEIKNIVSSTLARASTTAEIINNEINVNLHLDKRLQERYLGVFQGVSKFSEKLESFKEENAKQYGVELYQDFESRVIQVINSLLPKSLVVSHGGVFRCLQKYLGCSSENIENCGAWYFRAPIVQGNPWFSYEIT